MKRITSFAAVTALFLAPLVEAQTPPTPTSVPSQPDAFAVTKSSPSAPTLQDGTPVKLRLGETLSSATAHVGQTVEFEVLEEVKVADVTIIPKGGIAWATVTEAHSKKSMLSSLIDVINQRFGTDFKLADQLFFEQIREEAVADTAIQQAARVNTLENFGYVFDRELENKFIERMDQNSEIFLRYMNDREFQQVVAERLRKDVYEQIKAEPVKQAVQPATT